MEILKEREILVLTILLIISISSLIFKGLNYGIDLQGGAEIKLKTEKPLSEKNLSEIVKILETRYNARGIRDVNIFAWGKEYIIIQIAGISVEEARKLAESQGKLEVKIGNETVFTGRDIIKIEPYKINPETQRYGVPFVITETAARKFREVAIKTNFSLPVDMYLDGVLVNSAPIGEDLKLAMLRGEVVKALILETGYGEEAKKEAERIEIILRSGVLPIKLHTESVLEIPPRLGERFKEYALIAAIAAIILVSLIVAYRYKNLKISMLIIFILISEVLIILGISSIIGHDWDLASIAGLIISIGTGVDHQIIITDQLVRGRERSMRLRLKTALFILVTSWILLFLAMVPLFYIGIAMLKGFALITIIGYTVGVFITRPAFAKLLLKII